MKCRERPVYLQRLPDRRQYRTLAVLDSAKRMQAAGLSRYLSSAEKHLLADAATQETEAQTPIRIPMPFHKGGGKAHLPDTGLPMQFEMAGVDYGHRTQH